eukprot:1895315-Rhodomonas_salina.1
MKFSVKWVTHFAIHNLKSLTEPQRGDSSINSSAHRRFGHGLADLVQNFYWNGVGDVAFALLKVTSALARCHYWACPRRYARSTRNSYWKYFRSAIGASGYPVWLYS